MNLQKDHQPFSLICIHNTKIRLPVPQCMPLTFAFQKINMNKTILITGSSSGIGRATVLHFQSKGWNVAATMRRPENETSLQQLDNTLVTRLDVTDADSIHSAVKETIDRFGGIDVLVNNAGYGAYGPLESWPMEKIRKQFETNVIGLMEVTKAVLPHFRTNRKGMIINISSVGGKMTFPLGSLYHGTKFAVEGISEALSYEVSAFGGCVKIVEPGMIATDFAGRSFDFHQDQSMPEYQPVVGSFFSVLPAMAQQASPAEMVAEVIFTAATDGSNQLRYTAGQDAEILISNRQKFDDNSFMGAIRAQFGL
jgi:NAD(P)-dependent dehydrogenase (short-subunit alcohol dehydrogenase family)